MNSSAVPKLRQLYSLLRTDLLPVARTRSHQAHSRGWNYRKETERCPRCNDPNAQLSCFVSRWISELTAGHTSASAFFFCSFLLLFSFPLLLLNGEPLPQTGTRSRWNDGVWVFFIVSWVPENMCLVVIYRYPLCLPPYRESARTCVCCTLVAAQTRIHGTAGTPSGTHPWNVPARTLYSRTAIWAAFFLAYGYKKKSASFKEIHDTNNYRWRHWRSPTDVSWLPVSQWKPSSLLRNMALSWVFW